MLYKFASVSNAALALSFAVLAMLSACSPAANAQNTIPIFGPVDIRLSSNGTGYGNAAVDFNSATLNLTCNASPIIATLSSTADNLGNLLVDNNINVTVTAGGITTGPTNICIGGVNGSPTGPFQNCFTQTYEDEASSGAFTGKDPDLYSATGGVKPVDISSLFVSGQVQVNVDLVDEGGYLANTSVYLTTNCTQGGVSGPAKISGNPIYSNNPTGDQLAQDFDFDSTTNQMIGFDFDLSAAQAAGTLSITDDTIPQTSDLPIDPATFQSTLVPQTSFATSNCLIHSGELLPNGQPACKLYTFVCKIGTGATASGAQCPVSTDRNEVFHDTFDGPSFTLPDISTPSGPTFHQGLGFLMASEGWGGGPCTFDPASGLEDTTCPQNLLTSFTGPGTYAGTARTTHPNSTFIVVAQVPEDLTTISVTGQHPGGWINSSTANFTLTSQPPVLAGTHVSGAANFVPSPIASITYGITTANSVPSPDDPATGETILTNPLGCPTHTDPGSPTASTYGPIQQSMSNLADGYYQLHYYAQDCAGTEELKFTQDGAGSWSTHFYTYSINVDTVRPSVSTPVLSPPSGVYTVGQTIAVTYACTDALSGVAACGTKSYAPGTTNSTGTVTSYITPTSTGTKTFTANVADSAGNKNASSVQYQVNNAGFDHQMGISFLPAVIPWSSSTNIKVEVNPGQIPGGATGAVQIYDAGVYVGTAGLGGDNAGGAAAYFHYQPPTAGAHAIYAYYPGDAHNPAGISAPSTLTVKPGAVTLTSYCPTPTVASGSNYTCTIFTNSIQAGSPGVFKYRYDNAMAVPVTMSGGNGTFTLPAPAIGSHSVVVFYEAQGNYTASPNLILNFKVVSSH